MALSEDAYKVGVAWLVTFHRDRFVPSYRTEKLVVFVEDECLQLLLDAVRSIHPRALIETAERLGNAVYPAARTV